jgi:hypothetical protein
LQKLHHVIPILGTSTIFSYVARSPALIKR